MALPYFQVDTRNEHLKTLTSRHTSLSSEFNKKLILSWIYHDYGLEGIVLDFQELLDALKMETINPRLDSNTQALYLEIRSLHAAIEMLLRELERKKGEESISKTFVHACYQKLNENVKGQGDHSGFRTDDNRYGAYYHKCCPHQEIEQQLRKLLTSYNQTDQEEVHPLVQAAQFHYHFMRIMPYGRLSGRIARLLTNLILMRHGYPPAIIHTVERARYYEALAHYDEYEILIMLREALNSTVESGVEYLRQGIAERQRKREARKTRQEEQEEQPPMPVSVGKSTASSSAKSSPSSGSTAHRTSKTKERKREAAKKSSSRKAETASSTRRSSARSSKTT